MNFELMVTREVTNPFGYSRQFVQDKAGSGTRVSSFLITAMPHPGGREKTRGWHHWQQQRDWPLGIFPRTQSSGNYSKALPASNSTGSLG
jgi:hypothetical protein